MIPLFTAEFYGTTEPDELIGAVDVPAGRADEYIRQIGRILCKIRKRNSLRVVILNAQGEAVEETEVYR